MPRLVQVAYRVLDGETWRQDGDDVSRVWLWRAQDWRWTEVVHDGQIVRGWEFADHLIMTWSYLLIPPGPDGDPSVRIHSEDLEVHVRQGRLARPQWSFVDFLEGIAFSPMTLLYGA